MTNYLRLATTRIKHRYGLLITKVIHRYCGQVSKLFRGLVRTIMKRKNDVAITSSEINKMRTSESLQTKLAEKNQSITVAFLDRAQTWFHKNLEKNSPNIFQQS